MSYCKIYCGVPPTEVDKCEMLKPQLVRMAAGTRKIVNFKLFETCFDGDSSTNRRIRNIMNRFIPNLQQNELTTMRWKIVSAEGKVICNGRSPIDSDNLFSVVIPALEDTGYFNLVLFRRGALADSRCTVKVFICP